MKPRPLSPPALEALRQDANGAGFSTAAHRRDVRRLLAHIDFMAMCIKLQAKVLASKESSNGNES